MQKTSINANVLDELHKSISYNSLSDREKKIVRFIISNCEFISDELFYIRLFNIHFNCVHEHPEKLITRESYEYFPKNLDNTVFPIIVIDELINNLSNGGRNSSLRNDNIYFNTELTKQYIFTKSDTINSINEIESLKSKQTKLSNELNQYRSNLCNYIIKQCIAISIEDINLLIQYIISKYNDILNIVNKSKDEELEFHMDLTSYKLTEPMKKGLIIDENLIKFSLDKLNSCLDETEYIIKIK